MNPNELKKKIDTEDNNMEDLDSEVNESKILKKINPPKSTRNNALRFSLYPSRKDIAKNEFPSMFSYASQPTYGNEVKKNGGIDFDKYQKRNIDYVLGINKNPSGLDYNPKYSLVTKDFIDLEKYKKAEYYKKKNLLRKLWKNNSESVEYQIVKI